MNTKKQSPLSQRACMFLIAFPFWLTLAFWSVSAFWQHVDSLKLDPDYLWPARVGACSSAFAILAMVFLKCFSKHINVRFWALVLGTGLIIADVAHTAGLRGLNEAQTAQVEAEKRMEESLTRMSRELQRGTKQKAKVAEAAQKEMADTIRAGNDKVKDSSIFPRWYLDGWMYAVLFALSALALAVPLGMMGNRLDIDANFDGKPDHLEQPHYQSQELAQRPTREFFDDVTDVPVTGRLEEPGKAPRR